MDGKLSSKQTDGMAQLDSTLSQLRERCNSTGSPWESSLDKREDGSLRFTLDVGAIPKPPTPPEVQAKG